MSKYTKLISNTLLFGIATFGSKLLTLFLMPFLTGLLTEGDYSTMDLVTSTCNFIVPIISLCVHEAVIRFGLDKSERKSDVFTTAVLTIFTGYCLLLICYPLLNLITRINSYILFIYLYVLMSAMRSATTHFVRASGFVRIFALDGLFTTITTVILVFVFVGPLQGGVTGYVTATIIADALSAFGLILLLRLYRFFKPRKFSRDTLRDMLRYSIPLVPTAVFWWVTNLSDRYLVDWLVSPEANGLYAAAARIPTMMTLVSTIFIQAWQISAFSENDEKERASFYSTVFTAYHTLIFVAASALILLVKPIAMVLMPKYYPAWQHMPFLVLAVSCSCLVTFLGTIYNVAKSNRMVSVTTFIGAATNIILNLLLIPKYEANGAAFATFISYFIVFIIRAVDTRRYIAIRMRPLRIGASLCLLLVQVWASMSEVRFWIAIEAAVFILLVLCNMGPILYMLKKIGGLLRGRQDRVPQ